MATFTDGTTKKCFNAIAGQLYNAGTVCAEILNNAAQGDMVRITYDTTGSDYCLSEVQAYFGSTIPSNGSNNPQPGQFPAKLTGLGCVRTATVLTPLTPKCCSVSGSVYSNLGLRLAAHSSVTLVGGGGGQTAWSTGIDVSAGGSWATYSPVSLNCGCMPVTPVKSPTKAPTKSPTKAPTKVSA